MKLGAEPKKVAVLGALLLLGGYSFYTNVLSGPDYGGGQSSAPVKKAAPAGAGAPVVSGLPEPPQPGARAAQRRQMYGRAAGGEFRPTLKYTRPEDRPDPMKIDPTLRLDLLAKLQNVTVEGGHRTLFDFGASAPPPPVVTAPKTPEPKIIPGQKNYGRIYGPLPKPPDEVKAEAPKPPPPPIPLKFYGFSDPKAGVKRAFFLEGTEDIFVAGEGELIKRRYRVVKIGLNSAVVEDTEHKNQQTLPLEAPPPAGD